MTAVECGRCGRPSTDQLDMCTTCAHTLATELRTIPALIAELTLTSARLDKMGRDRVGGKGTETPLPIRLDRNGMPHDSSLLNALDRYFRITATALADRHNLRPNRRYVIELVDELRAGRRTDNAAISLIPATQAEIAAVWLSHHPHWLRTLTRPIDTYDHITALLDKARRAIDRMPTLAYRGPCAECGANMAAEEEASLVECGRCHSRYDSREVRDGLFDQVHDWNLNRYGVLHHIELLLDIKVPDGTFRSWASTKRITPRQWLWHGDRYDFWIHRNAEPLYRVGDAIDLAKQWRKRPTRQIPAQRVNH
ncbi:hypothetical protein CH302_01000 [Rhodococcus sp. 15-2388-1-1a]|uniref:hypothetical protein n=1 Tax=Nocardiaceae TaxID=85025 RepID=UPI00055E27E3|nr:MULTISPECIES: hypothetical protein [Rhodococcus]OZF05232.1 hypothetical protein CH302_01000 [Rhodococcus sp. 15-2388-1-1a]